MYKGYIGTYTKGDSQGIYTFTLHTDTQTLSQVELAAELGNPTYLAISGDNKRLYSVIKKGIFGGVAAYRIDAYGKLVPLGDQVSKGAAPCYVAIDSHNRHVLSANYHKGTVDLYPVGAARGVEPVSDTVWHEGSGPDKSRQEGPHLHFADFTPDEHYLVTIDLGTDRLTTYSVQSERLIRERTADFQPGTGPRHIAFHPLAPFAYVLSELSNEVVALTYDANSGRFAPFQTISTLPKNFVGKSQGAAIKITSDGRHVYASNRGDNSIAVFRTERMSGRLSLVEHVSTAGDWPRDFALDPSEKFLIAANQNSGNLVLYKRDPETGRLIRTASEIKVPDPVCIKFLHV
ncbi:lactonase family protein [Sporolactobacillus sp. THM7-7]|nr:lactonase family protein [Sporolactobacillus sp. THM7-7]